MPLFDAFLTALTIIGSIVVIVGFFISWVAAMLTPILSDVSAKAKVAATVYAFMLPVIVLTLLIAMGRSF